MHDNQNKVIGYMIVAIVAYYILSAIMPFLIWGLIGLVVVRIYMARNGR